MFPPVFPFAFLLHTFPEFRNIIGMIAGLTTSCEFVNYGLEETAGVVYGLALRVDHGPPVLIFLDDLIAEIRALGNDGAILAIIEP